MRLLLGSPLSRFHALPSLVRLPALLLLLLQVQRTTSLAYVKAAGDDACDYSSGQWEAVRNLQPRYSHLCPFIRGKYNCLLNQRPQNDYMNYVWKPHQCELPFFHPDSFLETMRNKVLAFVGDSINRELVESLICQIETRYKVVRWLGVLGRRRQHGVYVEATNTTIMWRLNKFLLLASNRPKDFERYGATHNNNRKEYLLWMEKPDPVWFHSLEDIDYLVLETGHFYRYYAIGFVENYKLINFPENTHILEKVYWAYEKALTTLRDSVLSKESRFKGKAFWLSYLPNNYDVDDARCPMAAPHTKDFSENVVLKRAHRYVEAEERVFGNSAFNVIDIAKLASFRGDARVQLWMDKRNNSNLEAYNRVTNLREGNAWDCLHFCLPGVPDTWVDIFQHLTGRPSPGITTGSVETA